MFHIHFYLTSNFYYFQIRTLGMLRSRFESLPGAFNACLIPEEKGEPMKKKGLKATLSRKYPKVSFPTLKFLFSCFLQIFVPLILRKNGKPEFIYLIILQIPSNKEKAAARFAQLWNTIISSFREEDLISNR